MNKFIMFIIAIFSLIAVSLIILGYVCFGALIFRYGGGAIGLNFSTLQIIVIEILIAIGLIIVQVIK